MRECYASIKVFYLLLLFHSILYCPLTALNVAPSLSPAEHDLVVVMIVDQLSYHQLMAIKPFVKHGFKRLFEHATVYDQARHPHACPTTATGHAALSTGTLACDHGITLNCWIDRDGNKQCYFDSRPESALFMGQGVAPYGASAQNLMVDTLSDQCLLASTQTSPYSSYALSYKCRAAVGLAGKRGKPIWLNPMTLRFTSSKAFFEELPPFVHRFNELYAISSIKSWFWKRVYEADSAAYNFQQANNCDDALLPYRLIDTTIMTQHGQSKRIKRDGLPSSTLLTMTPRANSLLFKLAHRCLRYEFKEKKCKKLLLWVSLSPLDRLGHTYGPYSHEVIDMLYHLDHQIDQFMTVVCKRYPHKKPLFVLTADHGVMPLPSHLKTQGHSDVRRIHAGSLIKAMNKKAQEICGHDRIIAKCMSNHFFCNQQLLQSLDPAVKEQVLKVLTQHLRDEPGIAAAWTFEELAKAHCPYGSREYWAQQQLFPGRTGELITLPNVHATISKHHHGATHRSPYDYDVHVPLMIYDPEKPGKTITAPCFTTQLASTLAQRLGIPPPSASRFCALPE